MKKKIILLLAIFLLVINISYARWFVPDTPPSSIVSSKVACLVNDCNMSSAIYMNGNPIYGAVFINATINSTTEVNATDIKNPIWLNLTGGTMSGDINMNGYSVINIGKPTAIDWSNVTIALSQIYNLNNLVIDASQITNPTWVNKSGDTMTGTLNMLNNDLINIKKITANDWSNVTITQAQISDLQHTYGDNNYIYSTVSGDIIVHLNESKLNATIQQLSTDFCANGFCKGNLNLTEHNITDVSYLWFKASNTTYFTYNPLNGTLQLVVNNKVQQDWGHSTTIYGQATFLSTAYFQNIFLASASGDSLLLNTSLEVGGNTTIDGWLFANGTYVTDVCHSNGKDCNFNSSFFNTTDYCYGGHCGPLNVSGNIYSNGTLYINGIDAININVINLTAQQVDTVVLMAQAANITNLTVQTMIASLILAENAVITNLTVERMAAEIVLADNLVVNGSITGVCLTNGTGCPSFTVATDNIYIYNNNNTVTFNETKLNQTIVAKTGIKILTQNITVSGSIGTGQTSYTFPDSNEILRVSVFPTSLTNEYHFSANTSVTGDFVDLDKQQHIGNWKVAHDGSTIQNQAINFYITNASIDEVFTVEVRFR